MKICVFGLWHLGCVTSASLAKLGHSVIGLDFDAKTVDSLSKGVAPVSEPGLNELIAAGIGSGKLSFSSDASVVSSCDALWVTFDTAVNDNDVADAEQVFSHIQKISAHVSKSTLVVISSQVPVGFSSRIEKLLGTKVAYSPENLRLGKSLDIFLQPDRIVVGTSDKESFSSLFLSISPKIEWMKTESAEMAKHAINSFLAMSVSFANEIALVCEKVGADAKEVERALKTEQRIGPFARVGPGTAFAGGTLARDVVYLSDVASKNNVSLTLIPSIKKSNDLHKSWVQNACTQELGAVRGKNVAVLGLTYKPGTDTLRRSLSVELCKWLISQGAIVHAFDPAISKLPTDHSDLKITLHSNISAAVKDCSCVIISTEWPAFRELNADTKKLLSGKIIIDPNGFIRQQVTDVRATYRCVGART